MSTRPETMRTTLKTLRHSQAWISVNWLGSENLKAALVDCAAAHLIYTKDEDHAATVPFTDAQDIIHRMRELARELGMLEAP